MPDQSTQPRVPLSDLRTQVRPDLLPLNGRFSYFCAGPPLSEEDVRDYLEEPIAALPPQVATVLPKIALLLVPFLERNGHQSEIVAFEAPPESKSAPASMWLDADGAVLTYAIDDMEVATYHYELFRHLAALVADSPKPHLVDTSDYDKLLQDELKGRMHGEVDDLSWKKKQELLRRNSSPRVKRDGKTFKEYARQSFIDTMTLYLHGICCDIDVEPGPRQLPSPRLRKRLKLLQGLFPPPKGYAVFPEELDQLENDKGGSARR